MVYMSPTGKVAQALQGVLHFSFGGRSQVVIFSIAAFLLCFNQVVAIILLCINKVINRVIVLPVWLRVCWHKPLRRRP